MVRAAAGLSAAAGIRAAAGRPLSRPRSPGPLGDDPADSYAQGYYAGQDPYAPAPGGWYPQPPPPGWLPGPPPPPVTEKRGGSTGAVVVGAFLVLLGLWFLFRDQVGFDLGAIWPALAVALGALMVLFAFLPRRSR